MAYYLRRPSRDRTRINLSGPSVRYWTEMLETDEESLRQAVEAVGDRARDVRAYLAHRAARAFARQPRRRPSGTS